MSKTNCIQHRPRTPLVILHQDYLDICDNSIPAAIILKILEYWTDIKLSNIEQVVIENKIREKEELSFIDYDVWIYKTYKDFIQDSLGLLKDHQVRKGLDTLLTLGFIERRNNPKYQWDRTMQYKVNIDRVQRALNNDSIRYPQRMEDAPATDGNVAGNEAIPEITTEIINKEGQLPLKDFLSDTLHLQGKVSESTGNNPNDQWFIYRDKALTAFKGNLGNTPDERQLRKDLIYGFVAKTPDFNPEHWEFIIDDCIAHGVGASNISRFIEAYPFKDYDTYLSHKYQKDNGQNEAVSGPIVRTEDGGYYV